MPLRTAVLRPAGLFLSAVLFWAAGLALVPATGNPTFASFGAVVIAAAAWARGVWAGLLAVLLTNCVGAAWFASLPGMRAMSPMDMTLGPLPIVIGEAGLAWLAGRFRRVHAERAAAETALRQRNAELEAALAEVRELRDLLPVCAWCRRVRDEDGYWSQLEAYVSTHTRTRFTHGICPGCLERVRADDTPSRPLTAPG